MIELDRRTIGEFKISEKVLIKRAGTAVAKWIRERFLKTDVVISFVIGAGNNGEDGKVAASELKKNGYKIKLLDASSPKTILELQKKDDDGKCTLLIDAIFGTGLNRPIADPHAGTIAAINACTDAVIVSLDVPSGLDATSGGILGTCVRADYTLTFGLPKTGLLQEQASDFVGRLYVLDIGFPDELIDQIDSNYEMIDGLDFATVFKPRNKSAYKNQFGHALVLGGSAGLIGAPVLAAKAALRTGAGLVSLGVPKAVYPMAAMMAGPEIMTFPCGESTDEVFSERALPVVLAKLSHATSIILGPGLGTQNATAEFVKAFLANQKLPMVIDADALNILSRDLSALKVNGTPVVLTPHPGEMGRLINRSTQKVQQERFNSAQELASKTKATVVLKGSKSVIAHAQPINTSAGNDIRFSVNALAGNPGMAVGGSGDVLSGIIGAMLARGMSGSDAARFGVWLHARAGDDALSSYGGDSILKLIDALPDALKF